MRSVRYGIMLFAAALTGLPGLAAAQQPWPSQPVRIIATTPPGGSVDLLARILAEDFGRSFGQPFVVENRPGANHNIGVDAVLKAAPDGRMFFVTPSPVFSINASIMESMPFNPKTDIAPISMLGFTPMVLAVHPSVPAKDLNQLLAWLRAQGGKANYGSQSFASIGFLAMELLKSLTSVEATHIPYNGSAAGVTADLLAGRLQMSFVNTSTTLAAIRKGQLRAIAVAESTRIAALPDIPTVAESGVPGFEATSWFGLGTRAGTPREIVDRLSTETARALTRSETVARLAKMGIEPRPMGPEPFTEFIRAESAKWAQVIRRTGLKAD